MSSVILVVKSQHPGPPGGRPNVSVYLALLWGQSQNHHKFVLFDSPKNLGNFMIPCHTCPKQSMYGMNFPRFTFKIKQNVGKYTMPGWYGFCKNQCSPQTKIHPRDTSHDVVPIASLFASQLLAFEGTWLLGENNSMELIYFTLLIGTYTRWWLNQPSWKICSSKWVHLPQGSGWK